MRNKKLVMIPGPTPVARSIQNEMGREIAAFGDADFIACYKNLLSDLKRLWRTDGEVFVVAGTGTLAMEMAVANSTARGDNVLCVTHGFFGDRMIEICRRKGLNTDILSCEWGETVDVGLIKEKLLSKKYSALTVTHVDTSTGVKAQIEEIGKIVREFNETIYIVDGVCSTAGEPEYVDDMGIDILFTASQKAFGVCPGLLILWAGQKALVRREELGLIPEYYVDFEKWLPIMKDPSRYFATPAINLIWALSEALRIIMEEGLENRYERHRKTAEAVRSAMETIGFKTLARENCRASTLSNLLYPKEITDADFRSAMLEEGIAVAGGLGPYAGKLFRLGHMGNIDSHDIVAVVAAVERTLARLGAGVCYGKGVEALLKKLE